jgi:hypothetical protein
MNEQVVTVLGAAEEVAGKIKDMFGAAPREFLRAMPDSLFLGTSTFALITQSFPLGMLTLAMMELILIQVLLSSFIKGIEPNGHVPSSDQCTTGLPSLYQITAIGKLLEISTFPSGAIFFVVGVLSYIFFSILNFRGELEELGKQEPEWKVRLPLSVVFSASLIVLFVVYRVWSGCDTVIPALGSSVFGFGAGFLIYLLHNYLFGRDAINMLGLPLLADRAAGGRPLYVCAKQAT